MLSKEVSHYRIHTASFHVQEVKTKKDTLVIEIKIIAPNGMLMCKKTQTCVTGFDTGATDKSQKDFEESVSESQKEWGKLYWKLELS